jgi:hypothetical protein
MSSTTDAQQLKAIAEFWGYAYTFSYDDADHPDEPHGAHRRDGNGTLRAGTPAMLLDAIKDDMALRPYARNSTT